MVIWLVWQWRATQRSVVVVERSATFGRRVRSGGRAAAIACAQTPSSSSSLPASSRSFYPVLPSEPQIPRRRRVLLSHSRHGCLPIGGRRGARLLPEGVTRPPREEKRGIDATGFSSFEWR